MKNQILSILIISTICWLALFGCAPSVGNGGESGSTSSNSVTSGSKINELITIEPGYGIESNSELWSASFILENKTFVIKPIYTSKTYSPVSLNDIKYVVSGLSGNDHSDCILNENKEVYCWGSNKKGQVGNGTFESTLKDEFPLEGSSFLSVSGYSFDAYKIMENVIQLFQSSSSFCAINTSNDVYCWGGLPSEQLKSDAYGENILQVNKPTKIAENIKSYYHQKIFLGGNETFLTTEGTLNAYTACHFSRDNLICPFINL
jgi:alpha-tubulin suppressor-like RCC1 family protein